MKFSKEALTKSKRGVIELRTIESKGRYVLYKYVDPKTLEPTDRKMRLCLRDEEGKIREFFIIPMKDDRRSLLLETEGGREERKLWNPTTGREEKLWD